VRAQRGGEVYVARVFQTFGITESGLDELVAGVVAPEEGRISFRASFPEVSLRVVVHGQPDEAARRIEVVAARLRERLGPCAYGEGPVTMQEVVGRALGERGLTLGLAESCTGGLVGHRLTEVPGSSAWLRGGVVAYADDAKQRVLGVREETLRMHGAVSEETAGEMAEGARRTFGSDIGVAVTGIAGPTGGTPEKPVGTVCFGLARAAGTVMHRYPLWGTRDWVKLLASQIALDWVRRAALGLEVPDSQFFRKR
jgi:nicotinamide-nucleotide amidase